MKVIFAGSAVPPSQSLVALNGMVVGLCIDNTKYTIRPGDSEADLYPEFVLGDMLPLCECVGTGAYTQWVFSMLSSPRYY